MLRTDHSVPVEVSGFVCAWCFTTLKRGLKHDHMNQRPTRHNNPASILWAVGPAAITRQNRRPGYQRSQCVGSSLLVLTGIMSTHRQCQLPQPTVESPRVLRRNTPQDPGHSVLGSAHTHEPIGQGAAPTFPHSLGIHHGDDPVDSRRQSATGQARTAGNRWGRNLLEELPFHLVDHIVGDVGRCGVDQAHSIEIEFSTRHSGTRAMEASLERKAETDQLSRRGTTHGQRRAELCLSQFVSGGRPRAGIGVVSAATLEELGNGGEFPFHEHRFTRMQVGDEIDEGAVGFGTGQLRCGT